MQLPKVINKEDLLLQIKEESLYQDLINQLNKDFEVIGASIDFSKSNSPLDLFHFLQEVVVQLLEKNFDVFLNLLYRIDVNETEVKKIIDNMSHNIEQQITFLLLKREWKKVWFRKYYS